MAEVSVFLAGVKRSSGLTYVPVYPYSPESWLPRWATYGD